MELKQPSVSTGRRATCIYNLLMNSVCMCCLEIISFKHIKDYGAGGYIISTSFDQYIVGGKYHNMSETGGV